MIHDYALTNVYDKYDQQVYRVIQNDCRDNTQYTPDATPCDFFL